MSLPREPRIGLMGGTFDPIHFGHLFIAEEARVQCELDEVVFVPTGQPAHIQGKRAQLAAAERVAMVQLATADNPHFFVSEVEAQRDGPSYLFDTLTWFRNELGPLPRLFFIMGGDSARDVLTWYRGAELFGLCHFVAVSRPGVSLEAAKAGLSPEQALSATWIEAPDLQISSTDLRDRVRRGAAIRYLLPESVAEHIAARGFYRDPEEPQRNSS